MSPGARVTAVVGAEAGEVRIRVAARPVAGQANRELLRFLSQALDVPRSRLELTRGAASRHKIVRVDGITRAEVERRLGCSPRNAGWTKP